MSERVSDEYLSWLLASVPWSDTYDAGREIKESRAELAAWETLGESPETVKAELELARGIASSIAAKQLHQPVPVDPPRPTPLQALEKELRELTEAVWREPQVDVSSAKAITAVRDAVYRARRAAGE